MPTPGIGDPYWYEWFVGLENVIKMLNPDSGVSCVIFQHNEFDTVDDIVVEYDNGESQLCYQVKHNIDTAADNSLTFGKMIESKEGNKCLFEALFQGWKNAQANNSSTIKPILFTNRKVLDHRAGRRFNGKPYSAYSVDKFISKLQVIIEEMPDDSDIIISDKDLKCQWNELCSTLQMVNSKELMSFIKDFKIDANQRSLEAMRQSLIDSLAEVFSCNDGVAMELFGKLLIGLSTWTTTRRKSERVLLEDVYSVLGFEEDADDSQHRLAHPHPFFESRQSFCQEIVHRIDSTSHKVVFISGDPGSGKTSTISYLQSKYDLFYLRYHTFKPISPEQRFYNTDPGMCTAENLWGTLLIQIRKKLSGKLAECNVPVCNKLIHTEELRGHVMRLLGVIAQENEKNSQKLLICIDGIDHAARANTPLTFLNSLPLPEEIPDGVCFVLAGQPEAVYHDQYPLWLSTSTEIERIHMPKLAVADIKQLVLEHVSQFSNEAEGLANLIFRKTEGNNLSVVFAVEEIRNLHVLEDVVAKLQQSSITNDIQQYYKHIWDHMKNELSSIMPAKVFPESIVACPLLLMNGRIDTGILAKSLGYGMSQNDWSMVLDRLFPLVVRTDEVDVYTLFHNDFRVFLMGVIQPYQARYKDIALNLAEYLLQNDEGMLSYTMGITLLQCAGREDYIPRYFTSEFVVNALAEGVSKARLDEFAHLSYKAACNNRDYLGYRNTYLAIKTLYQHNVYYEYNIKEYTSNDCPEISSIDLSEIRVLPIEYNNLEEYHKVLNLCCKLYSSNNEEYRKRALRLYHQWFCDRSPVSFVPLCKDSVSDEEPWDIGTTEVGFLLQRWGTVAAKLNLPVPEVKGKVFGIESYAIITFGERYFIECLDNQNFDLAAVAITAGYVNQRIFAEKLEEIYYSGAAGTFTGVLSIVSQNKKNVPWNLMAIALKVVCDPSHKPDRSVIEAVPLPEHIYEEASLIIVLKAFLMGVIEKNTEDETLIANVEELCAKIEGSKVEKEQAIFLARTSSLMGKYYWEASYPSEKFVGYSQWFLTAKLRRSYDYSRANKFLLYTLLNSRIATALGKDKSFIDALRVKLFDIELLGMFYKTHFLEYLVKQNQYDIVEDYIHTLYGVNCSRMATEENKADMHNRFKPYGTIVDPELMEQFSKKLKWDVVGYSGHKEYALYGPLECFDIVVKANPEKWKHVAERLYKQSKIADLSDNRAAYKISRSIVRTAASCGISDYWVLRDWDDEFRLNTDRIHCAMLEFISHVNDTEELEAIWILCCGIHSWYTQAEQYNAKQVYDACQKKARDLNMNFDSFVLQLTPQWAVIEKHLSEATVSANDLKSSHRESDDFATIRAQHDKLSLDDSLDVLTVAETRRSSIIHYSVVLEKVLSYEHEQKKKIDRILHSFCTYLKGKEWTYNAYDSVISSFLTIGEDEAFWGLAESIRTQLSDYNYQISSRNMQLLIKLAYSSNIAEMEALFHEELRTQEQWVTGNNHFDVTLEEEKSSHPFASVPTTYSEMVLYILLEQINTQNARKIEAAIYAIYLLGKRFPHVMDIVAEKWAIFSQSQEECLLTIISKWAADGACSEVLQGFLLEMYKTSAELSRKYYLHSILLMLNTQVVELGVISYDAPEVCFQPSEEGIEEDRSCYENFLSLLDNYGLDVDADAIRRYIFDISPLENYSMDRYSQDGDCNIPTINLRPGAILYGIEKNGRLRNCPLNLKKARLLPTDDPFILTEMPRITYDKEWFPEIVNPYNGEGTFELSEKEMQHIAHTHVNEGEIVLAATLWYPWGYKGGAIYTESSKIDLMESEYQNFQFDCCVGNFGLLAVEGAIEETCYSEFGMGGVSLFNLVRGNIKFYFGNAQIVPSSVWDNWFECKPKHNDPYTWFEKNGQKVLWLERIASPSREVMREPYIRQPILFRWVCSKTWLEATLIENHLHLYRIHNMAPYPLLAES